mgnify:FL=1
MYNKKQVATYLSQLLHAFYGFEAAGILTQIANAAIDAPPILQDESQRGLLIFAHELGEELEKLEF